MSQLTEITAYVYRGDDWSYSLSFTQNSEAEDLSGSTWLAQIRTGSNRESSLFGTMTVVDTDAENGNITLQMDNETTDDMAAAAYYADVQETKSGGDIETRARFKLLVQQDITQ